MSEAAFLRFQDRYRALEFLDPNSVDDHATAFPIRVWEFRKIPKNHTKYPIEQPRRALIMALHAKIPEIIHDTIPLRKFFTKEKPSSITCSYLRNIFIILTHVFSFRADGWFIMSI